MHAYTSAIHRCESSQGRASYLAHDTRLRRDVAIKVLPIGQGTDDLAVARLEREAQAIAALNHPNICSIYDIGELENRPFLVMERLEGETLAARLARGSFDVRPRSIWASRSLTLSRLHTLKA